MQLVIYNLNESNASCVYEFLYWEEKLTKKECRHSGDKHNDGSGTEKIVRYVQCGDVRFYYRKQEWEVGWTMISDGLTSAESSKYYTIYSISYFLSLSIKSITYLFKSIYLIKIYAINQIKFIYNIDLVFHKNKNNRDN